LTKKEFWI